MFACLLPYSKLFQSVRERQVLSENYTDVHLHILATAADAAAAALVSMLTMMLHGSLLMSPCITQATTRLHLSRRRVAYTNERIFNWPTLFVLVVAVK